METMGGWGLRHCPGGTCDISKSSRECYSERICPDLPGPSPLTGLAFSVSSYTISLVCPKLKSAPSPRPAPLSASARAPPTTWARNSRSWSLLSAPPCPLPTPHSVLTVPLWHPGDCPLLTFGSFTYVHTSSSLSCILKAEGSLSLLSLPSICTPSSSQRGLLLAANPASSLSCSKPSPCSPSPSGYSQLLGLVFEVLLDVDTANLPSSSHTAVPLTAEHSCSSQLWLQVFPPPEMPPSFLILRFLHLQSSGEFTVGINLLPRGE